AVKSSLLGLVTVILIAGGRFSAGEQEGLGGIGIFVEQAAGQQVVGSRCALLGVKRWNSIGVGRVRISTKIVIERNVLIEDYNHVFDGSGGLRLLAERNRRHDRRQRDCCQRGRETAQNFSNHSSPLCLVLLGWCWRCASEFPAGPAKLGRP